MPATEIEIPAPRANPDLAGHESAEAELRRLFESGRLPHAMLLFGPRGIGKATLAYRLARYILAHGDGQPPLFGGDAGLAVSPEEGVFRRVVAGGHADLLSIERAYDPKRRRMRSEIVVDDTREIGSFLRLTSAEGGWRIVIVDGADEMNRNAANALLKVLEEPPRRTLLLLVAHSPGRLLPTIRSRCRRFPLSVLAPELVRSLIARYRPDLDSAEAEALAVLSNGSVGRALELASTGGLSLYRKLLDLLARPQGVDVTALHGFADTLVRGGAENAYQLIEELIGQVLARIAVSAACGPNASGTQLPADLAKAEAAVLTRLGGRAPAPAWAGLRDDIAASFGRTDALNLDRKQALLGAFFAIERLAG